MVYMLYVCLHNHPASTGSALNHSCTKIMDEGYQMPIPKGELLSSNNMKQSMTVTRHFSGEGLYQSYTNCCVQLIVDCKALINPKQTVYIQLIKGLRLKRPNTMQTVRLYTS